MGCFSLGYATLTPWVRYRCRVNNISKGGNELYERHKILFSTIPEKRRGQNMIYMEGSKVTKLWTRQSREKIRSLFK